MKRPIVLFISLFYRTYLNIFLGKESNYTGTFYNVRVRLQKSNKISLTDCETEKSFMDISGKCNQLVADRSQISNCVINITGSNNKLILEDGVKLRSANVIIRGNDCSIKIGKSTTFGGVRIINVGSNNNITIGEKCLFSDHIEIWGSDTHPIFNSDGICINKERPIKIGDHVWVGSRVTILKGTTIEDGSIIGMGSVVTKDVPKNVVSAGYPNKTIRQNVYWKLDY